MSDGMSAVIHDLQTLFDSGVHGVNTDAQLLDRYVARGDERAFAAIVHRHGSMVWGVCHRILRDHHDAEDAFQATFLVLARRAASVVPREKVGCWLYGVARQTALKARAVRARRRGRELSMPVMPEHEAMQEKPSDRWLSRLDRELGRLPEK
jgi:RNA polymerase sigma factor (sigma-70 family)